MIVDVHAHFYPKPYLERLRELNRGDQTSWGRAASHVLGRDFDRRFTDIEAHIEDMDRAGVDVEVLSLTIPYPYFESERDTVELTKLANDELADVYARYPGRFKVFAALPFPFTDASLKELDRAIGELGFHGVGVGANVRGQQLDVDPLLPVYREINARNLTVFMHGMMAPGVEEIGSTFEISFGFLVDETLCALRLAQKGVFSENPNLHFIVPHMGQFLIGGWGRLTGFARRTTEAGTLLADDLRKLYYDSVCTYAASWKATFETVGIEQVVFGSDYPFGEPANRTRHTFELMDELKLTPGQREMILHGTAERLLR
jgi:predicted TIM-barrel fold metal-dependent hydrolase